MSSLEEWPRIKLVLEGALACEGAARDAYLARACGTDAALERASNGCWRRRTAPPGFSKHPPPRCSVKARR